MSRRTMLVAGAWLVAVGAVPYYLGAFWLQTGLFVAVAVIAALGLSLLVGVAGQLSLAHAFFVAVGAYTYTYLATPGDARTPGLGIPSLLAAGLAVLAAGACGGLFSPVSARLRGLYLGVASVGLVFLGQYLLTTLSEITGGYNGRSVPPLRLFGLEFSDRSEVLLGGVLFGRLELLWLLTATLATVAFLVTRRIVGWRPGLALRLMRESEVAAASMGINVNRQKAVVFIVSSMYAGLAGVLFAVCIQRVVPESFGLQLSVSYLAAIVIGGMRTPVGAVVGAVFVTSLPLLLQHYGSELPFLAPPGSGDGLGAAELSAYVYGALVVLVLVLWPGGLVGLASRLAGRSLHRALPTRTGAPPVSPMEAPVDAAVTKPELQGGKRR
ncbi:branched-chain amino acid ABC transporter permease [Micromonospora echinofusca]|uniref:Branched-chain amino acid ABC transporter permease n=1 Tax=Micromonospora echinofusca TaxID=47858 RepID=A0ABS3VVG1_MICEH|nr:branched-chain amino acid ABC transporter permease [Micromonospora echinofusca]MBO4208536.1 branched-chain amino acid ABC transporter permease [Micromonospora echinofusca]